MRVVLKGVPIRSHLRSPISMQLYLLCRLLHLLQVLLAQLLQRLSAKLQWPKVLLHLLQVLLAQLVQRLSAELQWPKVLLHLLQAFVLLRIRPIG